MRRLLRPGRFSAVFPAGFQCHTLPITRTTQWHFCCPSSSVSAATDESRSLFPRALRDSRLGRATVYHCDAHWSELAVTRHKRFVVSVRGRSHRNRRDRIHGICRDAARDGDVGSASDSGFLDRLGGQGLHDHHLAGNCVQVEGCRTVVPASGVCGNLLRILGSGCAVAVVSRIGSN
jgi:hypothetical protein